MPFSSLSCEIRRILDDLARDKLATYEVLVSELEAYEQELSSRARREEFFDEETAIATVGLCKRLLDAMASDATETQHRLTQLAIRYFVLEEDAESDNDSLIGFDDDLQVATAVIEALGLELPTDKGAV